MADPHIQSPMDGWDYSTVIIYRFGFVIATIAIALFPYYSLAKLGILLAAVCCASSLHIYLKHFRLLLQMATWVALVLFAFGQPALALGGAFVTLGGLCFKEYYCFRIRCLNLQPLFFALLWLFEQINFSLGVQIVSVVISLLLLLLSIQKWRMPLYFDIGDKSKYQV